LVLWFLKPFFASRLRLSGPLKKHALGLERERLQFGQPMDIGYCHEVFVAPPPRVLVGAGSGVCGVALGYTPSHTPLEHAAMQKFRTFVKLARPFSTKSTAAHGAGLDPADPDAVPEREQLPNDANDAPDQPAARPGPERTAGGGARVEESSGEKVGDEKANYGGDGASELPLEPMDARDGR